MSPQAHVKGNPCTYITPTLGWKEARITHNAALCLAERPSVVYRRHTPTLQPSKNNVFRVPLVMSASLISHRPSVWMGVLSMCSAVRQVFFCSIMATYPAPYIASHRTSFARAIGSRHSLLDGFLGWADGKPCAEGQATAHGGVFARARYFCSINPNFNTRFTLPQRSPQVDHRGVRLLGSGHQLPPPPPLAVGRRPLWARGGGPGGAIWGVHAPKAKRWSITGSPYLSRTIPSP